MCSIAPNAVAFQTLLPNPIRDTFHPYFFIIALYSIYGWVSCHHKTINLSGEKNKLSGENKMHRFAILSGILLSVLSLSAHAFCRGGPGVCYMPPCPAGMGCAQNMGAITGYVAPLATHMPVVPYIPTASMPSTTSMNSAQEATRVMAVTNNSLSNSQHGQVVNGATNLSTAAR